jgi:hypothetical protein
MLCTVEPWSSGCTCYDDALVPWIACGYGRCLQKLPAEELTHLREFRHDFREVMDEDEDSCGQIYADEQEVQHSCSHHFKGISPSMYTLLSCSFHPGGRT